MILVFTDAGKALIEARSFENPTFDSLFFLRRDALPIGGADDYYEQITLTRGGETFFLDLRYSFDNDRVKHIANIELFDFGYQKLATALDIDVPVRAGSLFYKDDTLYLTEADDTIYDGGGNDFIDLGGGDNRYFYSGGKDTVIGGSGLDTVVFDVPYVAANVNPAGLVRVGSGELSFSGVERLKFADITLALDVNGAAGQVFRLYNAAFGREPDSAGLAYWVNHVDHGLSLATVAGYFAGSTEFAQRFGADAPDSAFIDALYLNVLGRAADPSGSAHYGDWLRSEPDARGQVLIAFSESPENVAINMPLIGAGIELASAFLS